MRPTLQGRAHVFLKISYNFALLLVLNFVGETENFCLKALEKFEKSLKPEV
jgi:hypothetical protein